MLCRKERNIIPKYTRLKKLVLFPTVDTGVHIGLLQHPTFLHLGLSLATLATFALEKPLIYSGVAATTPPIFPLLGQMSERKFSVEWLRIMATLRWSLHNFITT